MVALRLVTIAAATACALTIADGAQARSPYDGSWSVSVAGRSGACAGGNYSYNVEIRNGSVHYYGGDARISGRVSGGGGVVVYVASQAGNGTASGRLRGNVGAGSFRGSTQQGPCAGTWSSQRTGG
jgi:hypothetical protein